MAISMDAPTELSSVAYPRVYRTALGWRLSLVAVGGLGLGVALATGRLLVSFWLAGDGSPPQSLWLSLLTLSLLGLYAIARALWFRVVLSGDRIELIQPFFRRQMLRKEIHGWRVQRNRYGVTLELVPQDRKADKLWIPLVFKTDDSWREWFSSLTDLDAEAVREVEQELIDRVYPHLPADERVWQIARLRRLAAWVNVASLLLILTLLPAVPARLTVLVCTLLPWVAVGLVARFQPLYQFTGRRDDPRTCLALPLVLPSLLMTFTLVESHPFHILDWKAPLILAVALGLVLTGAVARVDPEARTQGWGVLVLSGIIVGPAYGYGAGLGWNALADPSTGQVYPVTVLSKHVYHGTRVTTWNLRLPPWGPVTNSGDVSVPPKVYWSTNPGDTVCVYLKHGAFRIPWYEIAHCESLSP